MYSSIIPLVLALTGLINATAVNERAACNADNCLRAVRASTAPGHGVADCQNYLVKTTTLARAPTAPTPTVTTTIDKIYDYPLDTPTTTPLPSPTPGTIPAYAASCSGAARYSSACSCLSVTSTVVTISTVTPPAVTETNRDLACRPVNNYGHEYSSGSYTPPVGTTDTFYRFSGTAQDCCAACYRYPGCMIYQHFEGICGLTFYQIMPGSGSVINPFNPICKAGVAAGNFSPGNALGKGPCLTLS